MAPSFLHVGPSIQDRSIVCDISCSALEPLFSMPCLFIIRVRGHLATNIRRVLLFYSRIDGHSSGGDEVPLHHCCYPTFTVVVAA